MRSNIFIFIGLVLFKFRVFIIVSPKKVGDLTTIQIFGLYGNFLPRRVFYYLWVIRDSYYINHKYILFQSHIRFGQSANLTSTDFWNIFADKEITWYSIHFNQFHLLLSTYFYSLLFYCCKNMLYQVVKWQLKRCVYELLWMEMISGNATNFP